jgi:membrane associated rhomboid family serine protease
MKASVTASGAIFGLIALAHIWRVIEEGDRLMADPFFVLATAVAAALSLWFGLSVCCGIHRPRKRPLAD